MGRSCLDSRAETDRPTDRGYGYNLSSLGRESGRYLREVLLLYVLVTDRGDDWGARPNWNAMDGFSWGFACPLDHGFSWVVDDALVVFVIPANPLFCGRGSGERVKECGGDIVGTRPSVVYIRVHTAIDNGVQLCFPNAVVGKV